MPAPSMRLRSRARTSSSFGAVFQLAELLLDGLHLLVEVVLALALLHLLLDAAADALLDLQQVDLASISHQCSMRSRSSDFQHLLLLFELERHVGGDGVGQARRARRSPRASVSTSGGTFLLSLTYFELAEQERTSTSGFASSLDGARRSMGCASADEEVPAPMIRSGSGTLAALHQHLDGAVGQLAAAAGRWPRPDR
jgi:hypothetical protein